MQPVDSSAGAVRSSFVQGRGTTQYLGSPSLPPPCLPPGDVWRIGREIRDASPLLAHHPLHGHNICNAPIAFSVQHIALLCPQCVGHGSGWTIIQDRACCCCGLLHVGQLYRTGHTPDLQGWGQLYGASIVEDGEVNDYTEMWTIIQLYRRDVVAGKPLELNLVSRWFCPHVVPVVLLECWWTFPDDGFW